MFPSGFVPLSRETLRWTSEYGKTELVKDMTDTHVLNILHFLTRLPNMRGLGLITMFQEEVKIRGLKPTTCQIPHLDPKGRWRVWDFKERRNVLIANLRTKWP
jgi:hypothetical protein